MDQRWLGYSFNLSYFSYSSFLSYDFWLEEIPFSSQNEKRWSRWVLLAISKRSISKFNGWSCSNNKQNFQISYKFNTNESYYLAYLFWLHKYSFEKIILLIVMNSIIILKKCGLSDFSLILFGILRILVLSQMKMNNFHVSIAIDSFIRGKDILIHSGYNRKLVIWHRRI